MLTPRWFVGTAGLPRTSGDMIVRSSIESDLASITAIYDEAVRYGTASFELDPPDLLEMTRRRAALIERGFPYLVAEKGKRVVGYAYAGPFRSRIAYHSTLENSVYVDWAARGSGIGRSLLQAMIAVSERTGFRQMVAVIGDSGNVASIRLHEACGFALVGTLRSVGWKHGRWLDTVLMQRALGAGDASPSVDRIEDDNIPTGRHQDGIHRASET